MNKLYKAKKYINNKYFFAFILPLIDIHTTNLNIKVVILLFYMVKMIIELINK